MKKLWTKFKSWAKRWGLLYATIPLELGLHKLFPSEPTDISMGFWGALLAAALTAGVSYYNADKQKEAAKQGQTSSPWGPSIPVLESLLGRANTLSQALPPEFYGAPPKLSGGGVTGDTQEIADFLKNMGLGGSPFLDQAEQFTGDLYGGLGYNPILERLEGGEYNIENPALQQFIQQGMTGEGNPNGLLGMLMNFAGGGMGGGTSGGSFFNPSAGTQPNVEPNEWLRAVLDGKWLDEGNPHVSGMIKDLRREMLETYERSTVPQIDAQFQRAGRYGSNAYGTAQGVANEEINEAIGSEISKLLGGQYQFERGNMMQGLGLLNNLELQSMQEAGANSRAAGSSAASFASANRGQNLQALLGGLGSLTDMIGLESGDQRFERSMLMDMASLLSNDRMQGLGLIPGLEEARYIGPLAALQGQQPLNEARARGASARNQSLMNQWQYEKDKWGFNVEWPYKQLQFLADIAIPIGGLGGNTSIPYTGASPMMAGLTGGLGGGLTWQGLMNMFGNQGGGGGGNAINYYPGVLFGGNN